MGRLVRHTRPPSSPTEDKLPLHYKKMMVGEGQVGSYNYSHVEPPTNYAEAIGLQTIFPIYVQVVNLHSENGCYSITEFPAQ